MTSGEREKQEEPEIRRILVALDASAHSMAALEAAVQLAAELRAEVIGLFVEDTRLLSVADLPMTREVGSYSAVCRDFDRAGLERTLRTLRMVAERALMEAAEHARVPYTFRVERGTVLVEVLKAALEVDLVTLGHLGWSPSGRRGVGSTARYVIGGGVGLVLVARHSFEVGAPVYVVFDGSRSACRGLGLASRLAAAMGGGMTVLVPGDRSSAPDHMAGSAADLAAAAAERLRGPRMETRFRAVSVVDPGAVAQICREGAAGGIVLPMSGQWLTPDDIQQIAGMVSCPVLIVRPPASEKRASPDVENPSAA